MAKIMDSAWGCPHCGTVFRDKKLISTIGDECCKHFLSRSEKNPVRREDWRGELLNRWRACLSCGNTVPKGERIYHFSGTEICRGCLDERYPDPNRYSLNK